MVFNEFGKPVGRGLELAAALGHKLVAPLISQETALDNAGLQPVIEELDQKKALINAYHDMDTPVHPLEPDEKAELRQIELDVTDIRLNKLPPPEG